MRINNDLRIKIASMISRTCTYDLHVATDVEIKYDNTHLRFYLQMIAQLLSIVTDLLEKMVTRL